MANKVTFLNIIVVAFSAFLLVGCGSGKAELNDENSSTTENVDLNNIKDSFKRYLSLASGRMKYSVKSDSALYYYNLGWHQIMDEGRYGQAEASYRKALDFDPDFLICQAVLGRLTLDDAERVEIYQNVEIERGSLPPDEEELLGVYHDFVQYTNRRESGDTTARVFIQEALAAAEEVFRKVVHKYPEEPWMKGEYVEFLNSNHGLDIALDSLASLTRERHADNPFLLGFQASLEAKRGNVLEAVRIARKLEAQTEDRTEPKFWTVHADVYYQLKFLRIAKTFADSAVGLDPRNLDATRLKAKIDAAIAVSGS
ncbi:MAG: tetratricopeptide repeat protein [Lewinella sp.]|nr:tetratricopeptide repeat protein [Lewinella sp.]